MPDMNLAVSIQQIESKRSPAHVAQAVEHFLGKEKVPGSNPGVGSTRFPGYSAEFRTAGASGSFESRSIRTAGVTGACKAGPESDYRSAGRASSL